MTAATEWRLALESWAIPAEILAAAPESPWGFPPSLFVRSAAAALEDTQPTPSRLQALEKLSESDDASVLDVGAGGGAASLPLSPPAQLLVAVDESEAMLDRFSQAAEERGARHQQLLGRWPDIADKSPHAHVVVCHHVFYNVQDLAPFVAALSQHAGRRVVVELTAEHPMSGLSPLWLAIHGVVRPTRPVAADALAVVRELGYGAQIAYSRGHRSGTTRLWKSGWRSPAGCFAQDQRVTLLSAPTSKPSKRPTSAAAWPRSGGTSDRRASQAAAG